MIDGIWRKLRKKEVHTEKILFEMFYHRVFKTAYFITHDRDLAQDVTQETFIKAFKNLHTLNDGKKIEAWLGTIATRTAIDFLRQIKRWKDFTAEDDYNDEIGIQNESVSSVERQIVDQYIKDLLQEEILKLKPEYKQVIILKYDYELKDEEIASALQVTVGAVKTRLHRAKQKIRTSLQEHPAIRDGDII
ncbi:RNA polymerase sigma factor [Ammoniphilus sp. YIM 78166]|uniref:RNA polymerase sigma factor n=1 Tax=Ammoniphilus sp. YIM 78166 TaxID=1644106 RepID=UPI001F116984|nr:RNA polymerase sigma factor [Ammoniphilus sp. YIM 78166]